MLVSRTEDDCRGVYVYVMLGQDSMKETMALNAVFACFFHRGLGDEEGWRGF